MQISFLKFSFVPGVVGDGVGSWFEVKDRSAQAEPINMYHVDLNCSTPNPYPSPIHLVGVSIIIVKIYYSLSTLPYSPVKHLCRKNSIAEPPFEILTSNFLGYAQIAPT